MARKTSNGAGDLLELIVDYQLELLLPVGTRTRQERGEPSMLDLVFGTGYATDHLISCGLAGRDMDHDSDHLPVTTILSLDIVIKSPRKMQVWHRLNEKEFLEEVSSRIQPGWEPTSTPTIDEQIGDIVHIIVNAIENHYPESKISPRSVPG